jgi:hypothetical protein
VSEWADERQEVEWEFAKARFELPQNRHLTRRQSTSFARMGTVGCPEVSGTDGISQPSTIRYNGDTWAL